MGTHSELLTFSLTLNASERPLGKQSLSCLAGVFKGGLYHLVHMRGELTEILGSNSSYNLPKLPCGHEGLRNKSYKRKTLKMVKTATQKHPAIRFF